MDNKQTLALLEEVKTELYAGLAFIRFGIACDSIDREHLQAAYSLLVTGTKVLAAAPARSIDADIEALLWDSLKRDPEHKDRRVTGWGTKTLTGLIASVRRVCGVNDGQ
jgi:hypothetical protein